MIVGTVTLSPPDLPCSISSVMEENLNNAALMTSIQATASSWFTNLSAALANQLQAEPKGKGPLAEISYWRERHANLSALDEQLKRGYVQDIIKVLTYSTLYVYTLCRILLLTLHCMYIHCAEYH